MFNIHAYIYASNDIILIAQCNTKFHDSFEGDTSL